LSEEVRRVDGLEPFRGQPPDRADRSEVVKARPAEPSRMHTRVRAVPDTVRVRAVPTVAPRPPEYGKGRSGILIGEQAWQRLPAAIQDWSRRIAGEGLPDPVTGAVRPHWYCRVDPEPPGAQYSMFMIGQRGLAVAKGTCAAFYSTSTPKWRTQRWAVALDAARLRTGHLRAAPAPTANLPAPPADPDPPPPPGAPTRPWLPYTVEHYFGCLPAASQQFLLSPFVAAASPPQAGDLHPALHRNQDWVTERYWCYLFNRRWMSFAFAQRAIRLSGRRRTDRRTGEALLRAPWDVSAWAGPTHDPGTVVTTT
jgi:hypothetical protein